MIMLRRGLGLIVAAILAFPVAPALASSDPLSGHQWALSRIQAEQAWSSARGEGTVVAVVDTGVDFGHPDLAGKDAGAFDCFQRDPCSASTGDPNGHGTAVAGIIGSSNNSEGIAPVAPLAKILSVKALNADGSGSISDVVRAIMFASDRGAKVINLSLAGSPGEPIVLLEFLELCLGPCTTADERKQFQDAVDYAAGKGSLVVAAAGNENGLDSFYSGMDNVFVVGATGPDDGPAPYSSSGAEILAPGGAFAGPCENHVEACILTTVPGGYAAFQGTSFAAPHVSGIAALLAANNSPAQTVAKIQETADSVPAGRRVNAAAAVGAAGAAIQDQFDISPEKLGASSSRGATRTGRSGSLGGAAGAASLSAQIPPARPPVIELPSGSSRDKAGQASKPGAETPLNTGGSSGKNSVPAITAVAAVMLIVLSAGGNWAYVWFRRRGTA